MDDQGLPVPVSTLSDILREKDKWMSYDVSSGETWKKKQRTSQFPLLEMHLVEWVDRANHNHVSVNDYVMRVAAEELVIELSRLPQHPEDYTDFVFSNGWLHRMKQRHGLMDKKVQGEGGGIDQQLLPMMRHDLMQQLEGFAIQDIYNCDELALQ